MEMSPLSEGGACVLDGCGGEGVLLRLCCAFGSSGGTSGGALSAVSSRCLIWFTLALSSSDNDPHHLSRPISFSPSWPILTF